MKRIYIAPVLVVGLLGLAACGSSGSSANSSGPSAPPAASSAAGSSAAGPSGAVSSAAGSSGASSAAGSSVSVSSAVGSSAALPTAPGSVTVGSADFPENELLADIYGDAMAAKGVKVTKHTNIGERPIYMAALKSGEIGLVPEYSGSILVYLDPKASAKKPADVFAALQTTAGAAGLVPTKYAEAQDADTITVTKETVAKYKLTSIADLKNVAGQLTLGAPALFKSRADGIKGLQDTYGVKFGTFTPTKAGGPVTVNSLKSGAIDAADIFSTDPSIAANGFVSLADPKSMFAAQNVVPLFAQKVLTQPMQDACDAVSVKLDTKTLASLVAKISGGNADSVAQEWLKSVSLG